MMFRKISIFGSLVVLMAFVPCADLCAATKKAAKQSAIQNGTKVRTKVEVSGLYDKECYDAYYGCMDQFCISDNESGGSCACSDLNAQYEKELLEIKELLAEAERIKTVEVEKVQAGAHADIIFGDGKREYDEDGNIVDADTKAAKKDMLSLWNSSYDEEDEDEEIDISEQTGDALYKAAHEMCYDMIPEKCESDMAFLTQVYKRQITSDCKGFENSVSQKRGEAEAAVASAEADVRSALKDSLDAANKYDLGTCMVEFKKCMMTDDACGSDWGNCVSTIADANMQGISESKNFKSENMKKSAQKAMDNTTYGIAASTIEGLDSKRVICERVLNQCIAVRDQVWPAFLREAAPTIKVAEASVESKMRQSCLSDVSKCLHKACQDDIAAKGTATMDACLARPDMARSFCKIEIDRCEKMEPQIWTYVTDKLKAMRVDACTEEVKECFTAETRCGKNFENCIGMDYEYIHDICPIDSLVVCKADNPNFSMDDLDSMLMGLYLNVDNAALEQCQTTVDTYMAELCGSTTDCNRFAADEIIGTGSLRSQKTGQKYTISGMISFGSIEIGKAGTADAGKINVKKYIDTLYDKYGTVEGAEADVAKIIVIIEEELNNIAGTINRAIDMLESNQKIQWCVNGRSLENINGSDDVTEARFPRMLDQYKVQIAVSALSKAQQNYNKKLAEEIAKGTREANLDLAQYMCHKIAATGASRATNGVGVSAPEELAEPMSIKYEIAAGLKTQDLTANGGSFEKKDGFEMKNKKGEVVVKGGGMIREVTSVFSRETRMCHVCTTTHIETCNVDKKGINARKVKMDCSNHTQGPTCEDIPM